MEQSCRSEGAGTFPILNSGLVRPNSLFGFFFKREAGVGGHSLSPSCAQFVSGTGFRNDEGLGKEPEPQRRSWGRHRRCGSVTGE